MMLKDMIPMIKSKATVTIEGLGKIKKASVELKPLIVFVGPNNSGKTYLMTLLYGLSMISFGFSIRGRYFIRVNEKNEDYLFVKQIIKRFVSNYIETRENNSLIISQELFSYFERLINDLLHQEKDKFVKNLFGSSSMTISSIRIDIPFGEKIELKIGSLSEQDIKRNLSLSIDTDKHGAKILFNFENATTRVDSLCNDIIRVLIHYVFHRALNNSHEILNESSVYLPASRTGLLLTYKSVFDENMEQSQGLVGLEEKQNVTQYTRPVIDFLKLLNREMKSGLSGRNKYGNIIDLLNSSVIEGKIKKKESVFLYSPHYDDSVELDMSISSGVVTETTPLIAALNSYRNMNTLFIEEPEICLHPKLQHSMARCIVQIMNKHTNVIVSTHSDIIIQHLNNMIRLNSTKKQERDSMLEKYGYIRDDLLSVSDISVYQFVSVDGNMSVSELIEGDEFGFGIPAFNDEFERILNESDDMARALNGI